MAKQGPPTYSYAIIKKSDIRLICHVAGRSEDAIYSWSPIDLWYFCSLRLGQFKRIMLSCFGLFLVILDVVAHFLIMFFHSWVMFSLFFCICLVIFLLFFGRSRFFLIWFLIFLSLFGHFLVVFWYICFCRFREGHAKTTKNNQTMTKTTKQWPKKLPNNYQKMTNTWATKSGTSTTWPKNSQARQMTKQLQKKWLD